MKISEAIQLLEKLHKEHGEDLELVNLTDVDGRFAIDYDKVFDIVEVPCDNTDCNALHPVVAFMDKIDESQLSDEDKAKRKLRLV